MKFLPLFAGLAGLASAASVPRLPTQNLTLPEGYGHFATFFVAETGLSFDLSAEGYAGTPQVITLDQEALASMHSLSLANGPRFTPVREAHELEALARRDVCAKIATCAGQAAETAVTSSLWLANTVGSTCNSIAGSIHHYFTVDNYANLNAVLQGAAVSLVINIISTPIGDAILNSGHQKVNGDGDNCGVAQREELANDFANSILQFCSAIQAAQDTNTERRYQSGSLSDDYSTTRGDNSITRAFIASQAGNFGPICAQHGIRWKRFTEYMNNLLLG